MHFAHTAFTLQRTLTESPPISNMGTKKTAGKWPREREGPEQERAHQLNLMDNMLPQHYCAVHAPDSLPVCIFCKALTAECQFRL